MKSSIRAVAAIALISASGAWAVPKGGPLYIKSKETKVYKDFKFSGPPFVVLQPGTEVIWNGASENKTIHEISVSGKKGFVMMTNLSTAKPAAEIDSTSGKPMSAQAFASSGAATKALTPAGVTYAKGNVNKSEAAAEIIYVEQHNFAKCSPAALAAKAKELGGGK